MKLSPRSSEPPAIVDPRPRLPDVRRRVVFALQAFGAAVIGFVVLEIAQLCMSIATGRQLGEIHGLLLRAVEPGGALDRAPLHPRELVNLPAARQPEQLALLKGETPPTYEAPIGHAGTTRELTTPVRRMSGSRLWLSWIAKGVAYPRLDVSDMPAGERLKVSLAAPPHPGATLAVLEIRADEPTPWGLGHPATARGSLELSHLDTFLLHPLATKGKH